jgi:hypothetical protein
MVNQCVVYIKKKRRKEKKSIDGTKREKKEMMTVDVEQGKG